MKKFIKRSVALLVLAGMLFTVACTGGQSEVEETEAPAVETEELLDGESLDLPIELLREKYSGEVVTILTAEGILEGPEELVDEEGNAVDAFGEGMYKRTTAVEEALGIDLEFVGIIPWQDVQTMARQTVNSGADDYGMIFTCAEHQVNLVNEGLYLPIESLPYIDLEKPWWNKQYIDSVSVVDGKPYILFGDITYNTIQRTTCVFFNVNLLESKLGMEPSDLYELVYDGQWTLDKFAELVSQVYEDTNGNTKNDFDDIHGLTVFGSQNFNWLAFSCGVEFTSRDENGYPVLNLNNETSIALCDKLLALTRNNEAVLRLTDNIEHVDKFGAGKSLFLVNRFFLAGWDQLRTMKDDYGILPMPKYDENIEGYHSTVEALVQWGAVPVTVSNPDLVSATAEALAFYARMYSTPAYYETTLKLKQTRDDESMEIIDMIMAGRDTDFLFINNLGGMQNIFHSVCNAGQNNFASIYAANEFAANATLRRLITEVEAAE